MSNPRDLEVWRRSMDLVVRVYEITRAMPKDEVFGLRAQIRGSATSIPSNIAEGCGRNNTRELIHFVGIANGSLLELDTRLEIGFRTGMIREDAQLVEELQAIGRMLMALKQSLERKMEGKPRSPSILLQASDLPEGFDPS